MSDHTQGPWTLKKNDRWQIVGPVQGLAGRWLIATVASDEPIDAANALLMASAPSLLERCETLKALLLECLPHVVAAKERVETLGIVAEDEAVLVSKLTVALQ